MKSILTRSFGFFLATCFPIIYWHLVELPTWAEAVDGLLSSFVFSLPFGLGLLLGQSLFSKRLYPWRYEWAIGAFFAVLMWTLVGIFWTFVPHTLVEPLRNSAFAIHLILSLLMGFLASFFFNLPNQSLSTSAH